MILLTILAAATIPAGQPFTCTATHVWDGDGPVWCAEGPRIRLAGIATREINERCLPGHPCPAASGKDARAHLVSLLGGDRGRGRDGHVLVRATLRCSSIGGGKGARTAAWCVTASGVDLSCAMVASGYALRWAKFWRRHRCP